MKNIDVLINRLDDPDEWIREEAAYALRTYGSAILPTLSLLVQGERERTALEAIILLGDIGDVAAISCLQKALTSSDDSLRVEAIGSLIKIGHIDVTWYRTALTDPRWQLRASACRVLEEIQALEAIPDLIICLDDKSATVRALAAYALGTLQAQAALDALVHLFDDVDPMVRISAIVGIIRLQNQQALPTLLRALKDPLAQVRLQTLTWMSGNNQQNIPIEILNTLLDDPDSEVRLAVQNIINR